MWKSIEHFIESTAEQREIVSSVINRTQQRCVIDAADIKVSVPHFLLKECELEIRRVRKRNESEFILIVCFPLLKLLLQTESSLHLYYVKVLKLFLSGYESLSSPSCQSARVTTCARELI